MTEKTTTPYELGTAHIPGLIIFRGFGRKWATVYCWQLNSRGPIKIPIRIIPRWVRREIGSIIAVMLTVGDTKFKLLAFEPGTQKTKSQVDELIRGVLADSPCSVLPCPGSSPASCCASFVRMFNPQFAPLVEAGTKLQTVRPVPKRMPKPGDKISLRAWTGKPYRSKQRVLMESTITHVDTFSIDTFPTMRINDIRLKYRSACDEFARADGFEDYPALLEWFHKTHGLPFEGIVIHWHNDKLSD